MPLGRVADEECVDLIPFHETRAFVKRDHPSRHHNHRLYNTMKRAPRRRR